MGASQISTSVTIINSLLGFQAISFTNYSASALSAIAQGSKLEVASAFFTWAADETPNASSFTAIATASSAYLQCVPSGTAGSQILTSSWTTTAPTWSEARQGWYASAGSLTRVIGGATKDGATSQSKKFLFGPNDATMLQYGDGSIGIVGALQTGSGNTALLRKMVSGVTTGTAAINIAHGLTGSKIRGISAAVSTGLAVISSAHGTTNVTITLEAGSEGATVYVVIHYEP